MKKTRILLMIALAMAGGTTGCQVPGHSRPAAPAGVAPPSAGHGESAQPAAPAEVPLPSEPPAVSHVPEVTCGPTDLGASRTPRDIFRDDRRDFFPMLARDAKGILNWQDMGVMGASLGGAIWIHQDLDDEVREYVQDHPERWNSSHLLGYLGEVQYQVPVLLGVYGYSLHSENEELYSLSKALISAYTITGLSTLTVKVIADTERPSREWNDGQFGFPSFHTSSSFSIAAVVEEYEGLPTALPVYAVAGLIGWSRIDERDHDLSDVVFGAALGYVIGKSVARQHKKHSGPMRLKPYAHPLEPAGGIAAEWRY